MLNNLESIANQIRKDLSIKDEAREKMLPLCRDSIRYSSNAIRAVHRQEFQLAKELLQSARVLMTEAEEAVKTCNELTGTGIVRDAQKELAEANITLALVTGKSIPRPTALGVDAAAYLNGLGEAIGEVRRYLLDAMRQGDMSRGEELLSAMDDIYGVLVTMDFPDAITGGLRRTTDMVRGVLERTRSDLTLAMRQEALVGKLAVYQQAEVSELDVLPGDTEDKDFQGSKQEGPELNSSEMEIYQTLVQWRERKAYEENLAPFIIARNSWLKEIIKLQPSSLKQLYDIKGFGERRINKYGKEIIKIISKSR